MKKIFWSILLLPATALCQPTLNNAENFTNGTILKFINCNTNVNEGNSGPNQIWNFSTLSPLGDTITESIVLPSSTPNASLYPSANLVQQYSNGSFVYVNKTVNENKMVGYSEPGLDISYPDPILFAKRPVTYGSVFTDTFTSSFTANSFNFSGSGTVTISADAYGTLILPNATYSNVLRLTTTQIQVDTLLQFSTTYTTTVKVIRWFDATHVSALLKIDSTGSPSFNQKRVEYLLNESVTGIQEEQKDSEFLLYPNPAKDRITFMGVENGEVALYNVTGAKMMEQKTKQGINTIDVSLFSEGVYYLVANGIFRKKFLIGR
jgi:hypothetical protein